MMKKMRKLSEPDLGNFCKFRKSGTPRAREANTEVELMSDPIDDKLSDRGRTSIGVRATRPCHAVASPNETEALLRRLLLTREQVAELLAVPVDTVSNLHRMKLLRGIKIGKHLRWKPITIQNYVDGLAPEDCE